METHGYRHFLDDYYFLTFDLSPQRTMPACPTLVSTQAAVWRPVRDLSVVVSPAGPDPPAPSVRPAPVLLLLLDPLSVF